MRKSVANGDELAAGAAAREVLRWGGVRGGIPFIESKVRQNSCCAYLNELAPLFALDGEQTLAALHEGNVQRFDSGLTKIHSLLDTTGSPIYDSRVGAALAMLSELFRLDAVRHGAQHDWLGFPSGQPRGRQIRDPGEFGFMASPQFHTPAVKREVWARWQLSAGWIIRAMVDQTTLFAAEPASETMSHIAVRCHAFEAALFMIGYDLRSLIDDTDDVLVGADARNAAPTPRKSLNWVPAGHTLPTVLKAYREFRETLPADHGVTSLKQWLEKLPQADRYVSFRTSFSSYRYSLRETELNLVDRTLEDVQAIEQGGITGLDVLTYGELEFIAGDEREQVCFVDAGLAGYCQLISSGAESSNVRLVRTQFAGTEQSANTLLSVGRSVGRHFGLLDEKNWPTELFHRFYGDGFEYFRNRLGVGRDGQDLDPR
ncbi:hypothetical protein PQR34_21750 [Paraburkholderia sediminicola]|uniref:hypothetical protein n=1 Tax=Paraburkholderia sediminicola TaxID=458836 RepID=UPI0038B88BC4